MVESMGARAHVHKTLMCRDVVATRDRKHQKAQCSVMLLSSAVVSDGGSRNVPGFGSPESNAIIMTRVIWCSGANSSHPRKTPPSREDAGCRLSSQAPYRRELTESCRHLLFGSERWLLQVLDS